MDDSPVRPIELSQYDYAWDEGHFWNELASLFNRASSSSISPGKIHQEVETATMLLLPPLMTSNRVSMMPGIWGMTNFVLFLVNQLYSFHENISKD